MYAVTSCFEPSGNWLPLAEAATMPKLQRAGGHARIAFKRREGATSLDRLYQEGCSKIRLPRMSGAVPEAVLINTAGGLTGGDSLTTEISLQAGAQAVMTTQACERIYRSVGGDAEVATRIELSEGTRLDWLPQETILFDGGRLSRRFEADLAGGAELLAVEALVLGREAMGETVTSGLFRDRWRIRRNGRLLFADDLRLSGDIAALAGEKATLGGNRAIATILFVTEDADQLIDALRDAIGGAGGASAWDGKLVARLAAPDSLTLRRFLIPALAVLLGGRALPKVWQI